MGEEDLGGRSTRSGYVELRPTKVSHLRIDIDVFQEQTNAGRAVEAKSTLDSSSPEQSIYKYSAP